MEDNIDNLGARSIANGVTYGNIYTDGTACLLLVKVYLI